MSLDHVQPKDKSQLVSHMRFLTCLLVKGCWNMFTAFLLFGVSSYRWVAIKINLQPLNASRSTRTRTQDSALIWAQLPGQPEVGRKLPFWQRRKLRTNGKFIGQRGHNWKSGNVWERYRAWTGCRDVNRCDIEQTENRAENFKVKEST